MKQKENAVITAENEKLKQIVFEEFNEIVFDWFEGWENAPEEMAKAYMDMSTLLMANKNFSADVFDYSFNKLQCLFETFVKIKERMKQE